MSDRHRLTDGEPMDRRRSNGRGLNDRHRPAGPLLHRLAGVGLRGLAFALAWWALTEGDLRYPVLAVGMIAAATATSLWLVPVGRTGWSVGGLLRFLAYFARASLLGGLDVARRAFHPRLPIAPGYLAHRLHLPDGPARALFAAVVSLIPGTLSTRIDGDLLHVHVLDRGRDVEGDLRHLEERVGAIYRLSVDGPSAD